MTDAIRELDAEQLTEVVTDHGEGPVWHPSFAGPRLVDMLRGDILEIDGDRVRRWHVGDVAAAFRPRRAGGIVLADRRGFVLLDDGFGVLARTGPLWDDPAVRMNDGGCDPSGGFWCGSMGETEEPGVGTMWRLAPDLTVQRVADGFTVCNGFDIAPDGAAWHIDTATGGVDAFALDDPVASRRVLFPTRGPGVPDGMTIDAEGFAWVAMWRGGAVHRYAPDGRLDAIVRVPVSQVTACAFAGPDLSELVITTSRLGFTVEQAAAEPAAGAVFRVVPGVAGRPVLPFAG